MTQLDKANHNNGRYRYTDIADIYHVMYSTLKKNCANI